MILWGTRSYVDTRIEIVGFLSPIREGIGVGNPVHQRNDVDSELTCSYHALWILGPPAFDHLW